MERPTGTLSMLYSARPVIPTVRYLLYRVYLKYPKVYCVDPKGDLFTHRGHYIPGKFTLVAYEGGSIRGPDNSDLDVPKVELGFVVKEQTAQITWANELGHMLAQYLSHDPVWGPDWQEPERVKVRAA